MRLREFMRYPVVTCAPSTTIEVAAREMQTHNVGALVVTEIDEHVVGIVTDRGIALGVAREVPARAPIERLMTTDVVTIADDADIHDAAAAMDSRGVRRLPVVDDTGRPVGMLCMDDLLGYLREETIVLTGALRAQTPSL